MSGLTILHLLPWLNFGGVEKYVIGLSAALQQRGHRCIIVSRGGKLLPQAQAAGVRHIALNIHRGHALFAVPKLARIIDREQVDLLNAHNWTAGAVGFLAARLARIAYVFTVHGMRDPAQRFFVYYWGPRVITVSAASRDHLVRHFGLAPQRVVTCPIGVDTEQFRPGLAAPALSHELRLDPTAAKIVHVSRFSRGKAEVALRLIEAARIIEPAAPGFQVVIAGDGPLAETVARRADDANQALGRRAFVFAGPRADVAQLLSLADVVVGTATVALEAMACAKPVVAAGKAGFVGLVSAENLELAVAGCFGDHAASEPVTSEKLGRALCDVLADPARRAHLCEFGRRTVVRSFAWPQVAAQVEGIYRGVLTGLRPVRRIAVFHLNQIGDLVFSLPALAALRRQFPGAEISSIVRPHLAELMQASPLVNQVIVRRPGFAAEMRLVSLLRTRKIDLAVAFSGSAASVAAARACGASARIGFADADLSCLLNRRVHMRGVPWPGKLARLAACLGAWDIPASYLGLLRIGADVRERAKNLLAERGIAAAQRIAVLAPGASGRRRHKAWEARRFAEVGDYLHERRGLRVVIVGAAADALEAGRIAASMAAPSVNLAGCTSTGELAAILERAAVVVCVDSGPLHLAAALGTPVVAVFGPTDPARTGPQGEGHQVVTAGLACAPCSRPCAERTCMSAIAVEQVTAAVERVLG